MDIFIKIFILGFFINLVYEILHSVLYTTCLNASWPKYAYLMLKAALFDGFSIAILYVICGMLFKENYLFAFVIVSVAFAYFWEVHAINHKRWEYANTMPIAFGVGITPLIQLSLTGIAAIYIALYI